MQRMVRRFRNAQRRARYWSGVPTFATGTRSKCNRSSRLWEKYELAMNDQDSLAARIAEMGGSVRVKDYRREFQTRFQALMAKAPNDKAHGTAGGEQQPKTH
jgi:hypothetical protein